jgi:tetraacyldisaccharide 4'-kinase
MLMTPGSQVRWWLLWAAFPYGIAAGFRARFYQWGWCAQRKLPVPVISVGNLTVGGTGKTPMVIRLAEWLLAEGRRVAILSRGYGRSGGEARLLVSDGTQLLVGPREAGDEPFLIATRCPNAVVAVGADRFELGRWVLSRFPIDCVLLDDGFQHLALHRDVNLLLFDATDLAGLEAILPAGRLREPLAAAARATLIVVTRADVAAEVAAVVQRLRGVVGPLPEPVQALFRSYGMVSVLSSGESRSLSHCEGKRAILCSGVGHGASFRALAVGLGLQVLDEVRYPDHHFYRRADIDRLRARAKELKAELVVMTEKDAGKVVPFLAPDDHDWWAVRLGTELVVGGDRLRELILSESRPMREEACA